MSQADIASMIPGINHVLEAINKVNLDMAFGEITFHNIHTHAHTHKHTHTPEIKSITMEENRD